jgi:hypothetical protein
MGNLSPNVIKFLANAEPIFFTPSVIGNVLQTGGGPIAIGSSISALLGGGIAAFLFARICFERFCGEESSLGRQLPRAANGKPSLLASIRRSRPSRAWRDAVAWRDFYYLHGGPRGLFIKFVVYCGLVVWFGVSIFGHGWARSFFRVEEFFTVVLSVALFVAAFDSLFSTSRIYRLERRNKTLSSLYLLPQDIDELIRSKRRAVLLALTPALFFVVPSCLILAGPFLRKVVHDEFFVVMQVLAFIVAQAFLLHYLVALFSLKLKWGGLPLSLILWGMGTIFMTSIEFLFFRSSSLFFMLVSTVIIASLSRMAFRQRLVAAAAEE